MYRTLISLLLVALSLGSSQGASRWPRIQTLTRSVWIANANASDAGLETAIRGVGGRIVYKIHCHSGYFATVFFEYSGLLQCYVEAVGPPVNSDNLLDDNPSPTSD
jgi:hypothetical protein